VPLPRRLAALWPAAAISAAAVLAYLPALTAGFVFDDVPLILHGDLVHGPLSAIWLGREGPDYWPLTLSTFWVEWRLFGEAAVGYHAVNLALHVGAALLLWRVLRALSVAGAPLAGLLFAVHPVAAESVAWISELKNTLSAVLFLGTVLAWDRFDRGRRTRHLAAALALFAAALLAKTSAAPLPLVLLGITVARRGRLTRRDLLVAAPFLALAVLAGATTIWFQGHAAVGYGWVPQREALERLGRAGRALAFYVETGYLPVRLAFARAEWPTGVLSYAPLAAVCVIAAALGRTWRTFGRGPLLALGYQALMVLPVVGLVEIAWFRIGPVADHLQYLALFGPVSLGAFGLARLADSQRGLFTALSVGLVLTLAGATAARARTFEDELSLWRAAVRDDPRSTVAHRELAVALAERGRGPEALAELRAMAAAAEDPAERHHATALWLLASGRPEEAAREASEAVRLKADPTYRRDLAVALVKAGRPAEAVAVLEPLVRLEPQAADPRYWLGLALAESGRLPEAVRALELACRLAPTDPSMRAALEDVTARLGGQPVP
jgi:protein O-mannosyl-transferase